MSEPISAALDLDAIEAAARDLIVKLAEEAAADKAWCAPGATERLREAAERAYGARLHALTEYVHLAHPAAILSLVARLRAAEARAAEPCGDDSFDGAKCIMREEHFGLCSDGIVSWEGAHFEDQDEDEQPELVRCAGCGSNVARSNVNHCGGVFKAVPARLDPDGTAKPLTRIVTHAREGDVIRPGVPLVGPEYEDESGKRTALVDPDAALSTWTLESLRAHGPFADPRCETERLVAIGEAGLEDVAHIEILQSRLAAEKARADAAEAKLADVTPALLSAAALLEEGIGEVARLERRARRWEAFARRLWANDSRDFIHATARADRHQAAAESFAAQLDRCERSGSLAGDQKKAFHEALEQWRKATKEA